MPSTPGGEGEHPLLQVGKNAEYSRRRRRNWEFWTGLDPLRDWWPPIIPAAPPLRAGGGFAAARIKAA